MMLPKIEVRHSTRCPAAVRPPADRRKPRYCSCSPRVRASIQGVWMDPRKLAVGWTEDDLEAYISEVLVLKTAVKGDVVSAPKRSEVPLLREWGAECLDRIRERVERGDEDAYSLRTYKSYRSMFVTHIAPTVAKGGLGDLRLTAVAYSDVDGLRRRALEKGLAESTAKQLVWILSGMFEQALAVAAERGWPLDRNPAHVPRSETYGRRRRRPRRRDSKAMPLVVARELVVAHAGNPLGPMVLAGATTGLRQSELLGMRSERLSVAERRYEVESQVHFIDGTAHDEPPKYESYRTVPVYSRLAARWAPIDGSSGYVFLDPKYMRRPFTPQRAGDLLNDAWDAIADRPKGQSWHALRHLYSNLLDRAGVRERVREYVLGHSKPGIAGTYLEVDDEELDAIEQVMEDAFGSALSAVPTSAEVSAAAR